MRREYHHRRGENFTDEFGRVLPTLFVSNTYFEMIEASAGAPPIAVPAP